MKPYAIALAHQKGGVGKSTTVINLAVELTKTFKTTVLDLDPQQHTTKFNNRREKPFTIRKINNEKDLINQLQKKELTLIDLGGYDSELARTTLLYTDLVIIPLADSDFEMDGLLDFQKIMNEILSKQKEIQCKILVNRVHHADKATRKALVGFTDALDNFSVFKTVIKQNALYKNTLRSGKSITELSSGTPAIDFNSFTQEVIEEINKG